MFSTWKRALLATTAFVLAGSAATAAEINVTPVPCAGSVTPWGRHLGSEECPPDARAVEEDKEIGIAKAVAN